MDDAKRIRLLGGLAAVALFTATAPGCEEPFVDRRACLVPPRPAIDEIVTLERVFGRIDVEDAVALVHPPGDDSRWYVVAQPGIVYTFANDDDATPSTVVDITDAIAPAAEAGLLDIAFHPDFPQTPDVFLSYTTPGGSAFLTRISRMTSSDGGATFDPDTEQIVIEIDQPYSNHNGGDIGFGPDGYLYIGLGDGGSAGDPRNNAQDVETLLGAMLRIDVDGGEPYAIPPDNPFAAGGGRPEIWAWGLRNPWRWSFDRQTGDLWAGDVGQHVWEEVDVIRGGANYGWNRLEGNDCLGNDTCARDGIEPPVAQYRNTGTASVVGGYVYRGSAIPDLAGTYIFSDFYFGTIFGVRPDGSALEVLGQGADRIAAWAEGADGELYGVAYRGGIYRLVAGAGPVDPQTDDFPRLLSQTECVDMDDPTQPVPDAIAYDVNLPFWSDGADKRRFVSIPDGRSISVGSDGDWDLPVGTVLVKSFYLDDQPVETRLLVRDDAGWAGYGYAWNDSGSDAEYVTEHREVDGWVFPETRECRGCHTNVAGGSLGLESGQLALDIDGTDQLQRFVDRGWLSDAPDATPIPAPEATNESLDSRARAYLHVNCSGCHRPDGPDGRSNLDLRYTTPPADTAMCDTTPRAGDLGIADARIVAPGDPARSILSARMHAPASARMPPLSSNVVDPEGVTLIDAWIMQMPGCG